MTKPTAPKSKTPRPQCKDCPAWRYPAGCGYLGAGTPCKHSVYRHRFAGQEDETPILGQPGATWPVNDGPKDIEQLSLF